jgi:hypothetical protein
MARRGGIVQSHDGCRQLGAMEPDARDVVPRVERRPLVLAPLTLVLGMFPMGA